MELSNNYNTDSVNSDERLARIVLSPRDIDPMTNYPKDTFVGLRQDETGISFEATWHHPPGAAHKSIRTVAPLKKLYFLFN